MKGSPRRNAAGITAEDVARTIGVSQSTISRAFSASASIAPTTRERVMSAARTLGYQPNVIARSLITRRTNIVALVMANLVDPFYAVILDALTTRIQARGRQTLLFVPRDEGSLDETISSVLQYQVDGIILGSVTISPEMARLCAVRETPVTLFNRYAPGQQINAVSCDNEAGGREVAAYLARTGHRRAAFVPGQSHATTNNDRRRGFVDGCRDLGLPKVQDIGGGDYTFEAGFEAGRRIAALRRRPDAVFFASDIQAIGGLHALREHGIDVPGDMSVIGYDDVPLTAWPSFDLTTVRQPIPAMADVALDLLGLDGESRKAAARTHLIPGRLIERRTSQSR